jgi:hypothetical protein
MSIRLDGISAWDRHRMSLGLFLEIRNLNREVLFILDELKTLQIGWLSEEVNRLSGNKHSQ